MSGDHINAFFEGFGGLLLTLNIVRLVRDRKLQGVSVLPVIFWTLWGYWNCWYYPSIGQLWSFYCGLLVAFMNTIWVALALRILHRQRRAKQLLKDLKEL